MKQYDAYPETTIHEFKSNIARYIRALEEGRHKGIIVKRYDRPVGLFMHYVPLTDEQRAHKKQQDALKNEMAQR